MFYIIDVNFSNAPASKWSLLSQFPLLLGTLSSFQVLSVLLTLQLNFYISDVYCHFASPRPPSPRRQGNQEDPAVEFPSGLSCVLLFLQVLSLAGQKYKAKDL